MENQLIPAHQFCAQYNIEVSFLHRLQDVGLLHVTTVNESYFIAADDLGTIEKMVRLHQDLDINPEGIDAILSLLKQLEQTQEEITTLRNRLRLYEP